MANNENNRPIEQNEGDIRPADNTEQIDYSSSIAGTIECVDDTDKIISAAEQNDESTVHTEMAEQDMAEKRPKKKVKKAGAGKAGKKSLISRILPKKGYAVLFFAMAIVAVAFLGMLSVLNAFPPGMTMAFVISLFVLMILADFLFLRQKKGLRILGIVIAAVFLVVYGAGTYFLGNTYAMFARISSNNETHISSTTGLDLGEDSFNIYITGIDQWESEKGKDLERSDVNMIATISPKTRKILLTSIPRDAYVKLHTAGEMDKLTHTGVYGVDETLQTVHDWLGIDLHYYVKMNFTAVVDIINAMGGIEVYSPKEFVPTKRSWYTVKKGWNHMNGKEALAFARERKAFGSEDSKRVENQQRVVDAILKKMMTSPTLLTKYPEILSAASNNMSTSMSTADMQEIVKMQLADLGEWDIEMQKVEGDYDMDYVASLTQDQKFQVYKTDPKSVKQVVDKINAVMNPTEKEIAEAEAAAIEKKKKAYISGILDSFRGSSSEEEDKD